MTNSPLTDQTSSQPERPAPLRSGKPIRLALAGAMVLGLTVVAVGYPALSRDGISRGDMTRGDMTRADMIRGDMSWDGMHGDGAPGEGMRHGWRRPFQQGWDGARHAHERREGMMFGPGSAERMVNHVARVTDASSEQRQTMNTIAQRAVQEIMTLRQNRAAKRAELRALLTAPSIDRAKLEAVRQEQMKLADQTSKRMTTAMADIAEVLTPPQRAELARMMERRHGRRL